MKKVIQIFTGGWHNQLYTSDEICQRIEKITTQVKIDAIIIGWHLNPSLYEEIGAYLRSKNIEMYLWLPTFSEIGELGEVDPVIDIWGNVTQKYVLQEGESFEFFCPSSSKNQNLLLDIYDQYFSKCQFNGVFLDKIRTQSYIPGSKDVLGCCCELCLEEYKSHDYDICQLKDFIDEKGMTEVFKPASFNIVDGFHFHYPLVEKFLDIKAQLYTKQIAKVVDGFRQRGLKIGMDVYSPAMARLVGQDIASLTQIADFVKPMMYRRTTAPAGIGFEYQAMKKALNSTLFDELLECKNGLEPMSEDMMKEMLDRADKSKLYPGIEINYREDIARTDETYVKNSMQAVLDAKCGGIVFSWDVMLAPDNHIMSIE